jgi:hypothetical protein
VILLLNHERPVAGDQAGSFRRLKPEDLRAFPQKVRLEIGQALFEAQLGDHPAGAKPLKSFGSGVLEIRNNFDGNTFRAVYTGAFRGRPLRPSCVPKEIDQGDRNSVARPDWVRQRLREAETIHSARSGAGA